MLQYKAEANRLLAEKAAAEAAEAAEAAVYKSCYDILIADALHECYNPHIADAANKILRWAEKAAKRAKKAAKRAADAKPEADAHEAMC